MAGLVVCGARVRHRHLVLTVQSLEGRRQPYRIVSGRHHLVPDRREAAGCIPRHVQRFGCPGVTWNDVRDELGHATLRQQERVYGRGRMNREAMGKELDYRVERWNERVQPLRAATPTRGEVAREEREQVVNGLPGRRRRDEQRARTG
jgi:hypothetical protein